MRRVLLTVAVCLTAAPAVAAPAQSGWAPRLIPPTINIQPTVSVPSARVERVAQWLKALHQHEPGQPDESATLVGSWPPADIQALWVDVTTILKMMHDPRVRQFVLKAPNSSTATQILYGDEGLKRMRALARAANGTVAEASVVVDRELLELSRAVSRLRTGGDDNYVVKRGALLHADVAMLMPVVREPLSTRTSLGPDRMRLQMNDGQDLGVVQAAVHWELARMLLDHVHTQSRAARADPEHDPMVRLWYRATFAFMERAVDHDPSHVGRALQLFPDDGDLLFLAGSMHETFAAAGVQSAMHSAVLPAGSSFGVGSEGVELRRAEGLFRRALEVNPGLLEARTRLGRVLGLRGHHLDAAAELRLAVAGTEDPLLLYYGELFLGAEEEALGHQDAARAAYAHAATLYPTSQSPLLALSQLARRRGNRPAAVQAIQQMFALSTDSVTRDDPWWRYHVVQTRNVDLLLEQLRKPFRLAEPR
jgi:tetratricopeptide (TPR) repeat protein